MALPLEPENGRFCLFSIRFSQDGGEILGGANDGFIYLFDRERQIQSLKVKMTAFYGFKSLFLQEKQLLKQSFT